MMIEISGMTPRILTNTENEMKRTILLLLFLLLPALAFAQGASTKESPAPEPAQSTFTVQVRFQFSGATTAEARANAVEYVGRFLEGKIAADIYQRNGGGALILDGQGNKQFDAAKVQAVFLEFLRDMVDEGSTAARVAIRVAGQAATIEAEERAKTKPTVN
jgi:hypothetical protein